MITPLECNENISYAQRDTCVDRVSDACVVSLPRIHCITISMNQDNKALFTSPWFDSRSQCPALNSRTEASLQWRFVAAIPRTA